MRGRRERKGDSQGGRFAFQGSKQPYGARLNHHLRLTSLKYFRAWAAAASVHDDERAIKRLRTRQRFVNLSEEKAAQKQQHCEKP